MSRFCKVGLALGGGGARGLAHLGVLSVLEQEGIPIDLVTGTSVGAIVASLYAFSLQSKYAIEQFRRYLESREFEKTNLGFLKDQDDEDGLSLEGIFQRFTHFVQKGIFYGRSLTKAGPISQEKFARTVNLLLEDAEIEQAKISVGIVALDLKSGREVVLRKGPLRKAVSASCAIPGILAPAKWDTWELVDGGWIDLVPVRPSREMGADIVIAVDVADTMEDSEEFNIGLAIIFRANDITRTALSQLQLEEADVVITPKIGCHWSDFSHMDECLQAGEKAAREKLELIRSLIRRRKFQKMFHLPFLRAPSSTAPE